ncbi:hypothetical protein B4098_1054 [Heyndrickxia coagulans]|uniref:Uncharacterized protein n=1 Tax=Heyndrickxia coagulans TaxID=1398 RepID=A0A150JYG0_HEYCO|nr:hypothetical protein B4098_1054 [Heyndrickxia coagulans]
MAMGTVLTKIISMGVPRPGCLPGNATVSRRGHPLFLFSKGVYQ